MHNPRFCDDFQQSNQGTRSSVLASKLLSYSIDVTNVQRKTSAFFFTDYLI